VTSPGTPPVAPSANGDDGTPADILQFPMDFPVKVMGRRTDDFADVIVAIVRSHAPAFDPATLEMRVSRNGNYLSVTATIRAESRPQLDALYRELTSHPLVSVVL
jgi:putative lipoic acid-binding regulatory protein